METILAALITGSLALLGVIITSKASQRKFEHKLEVSQAITNTKLDCLTKEVSKYNEAAAEVPMLKHDIKLLRDDVEKLKRYHTERV